MKAILYFFVALLLFTWQDSDAFAQRHSSSTSSHKSASSYRTSKPRTHGKYKPSYRSRSSIAKHEPTQDWHLIQ